jgi:ankyrin repeat protein
MSQGADIEHRDETKCTPLHHAVFGGSVDTVRWILQAGADVNAVNDWFGTPLCLAAIRRNLAVTELLIEHHADSNQDCFNLGSAAHAACASGNIAIVQALNAAGVSWNTRRNICVDALSHLSQNDGSLVPYHKSLAPQTCQVQSPGAIAVKFRHSRVVEFCLDLEKGLSVKEIWETLHIPGGRFLDAYTGDATLVMLAMSTLDVETGRALLTHGADANAIDAAGRGALIYAVDAACLGSDQGNMKNCVGLLLRHGVDIDGAHKRIVKPISYATLAELALDPRLYNTTTVALVAYQYATSRASRSQARHGDLEEGYETALLHAVSCADTLSACKHCVEVLCEHGADNDLTDHTGKSAMAIVSLRFGEQRKQEVIDIMLQHGATPEQPPRYLDYLRAPDYGFWAGILFSTVIVNAG